MTVKNLLISAAEQLRKQARTGRPISTILFIVADAETGFPEIRSHVVDLSSEDRFIDTTADPISTVQRGEAKALVLMHSKEVRENGGVTIDVGFKGCRNRFRAGFTRTQSEAKVGAKYDVVWQVLHEGSAPCVEPSELEATFAIIDAAPVRYTVAEKRLRAENREAQKAARAAKKEARMKALEERERTAVLAADLFSETPEAPTPETDTSVEDPENLQESL
jgi:hypothetical protein